MRPFQRIERTITKATTRIRKGAKRMAARVTAAVDAGEGYALDPAGVAKLLLLNFELARTAVATVGSTRSPYW